MDCCLEENSVKTQYIQGDTFKRQVDILDANNEKVDVSLISKVEFLLLNLNADVEKTEEILYDDAVEKWIVDVDTSTWAIGTHLVRYRITYTDTSKATPYEITIQIKK